MTLEERNHEIVMMYLRDRLTTRQIGEKVGISHSQVIRVLNKRGIGRRSRSRTEPPPPPPRTPLEIQKARHRLRNKLRWRNGLPLEVVRAEIEKLYPYPAQVPQAASVFDSNGDKGGLIR